MSGIQAGLSKLKKKHFKLKHQKVKLFRANEPLLSVFMWGVNHTVCFDLMYLHIDRLVGQHLFLLFGEKVIYSDTDTDDVV